MTGLPSQKLYIKAECGAGGVGSIPKPLAHSIAQMLGSGMDAGKPAKSKPVLDMVVEGSDEDDE